MNDHLIYDSYDVQIGSIGSKLYQHVNNDDIHLTAEEKEKLDRLQLSNNTTEDGSTIGDLQIELNNKADKDDIPTRISLLENDLNFISEIPDYYTTEEEVKLLIQELAGSGGSGGGSGADISDLEDKIEELTKLVNQYGVTIELLRQLINQNTSDIDNIEELVLNITQLITNIDNRVTNIEEGGGGDSEYVLPVATGTRLGGVKIGAGINVTGDGTISVATSESGEGGLTPGDIATLDGRYLRKDTDDRTDHILTVPQLKSSNFISGMTGTGYYLANTAHDGSDNYSHLEIDDLLVRNKAVFEQLEIRKLSYVNGNLVLSAAGGTIKSVVDQGDRWKCYLQSDDGSIATTNTFLVNDLVKCETFNIKAGVYTGVQNKFYWRQILNAGLEGDHNIYVEISKSQCAIGSDEPAAGDVIVQFGNTSDEDRQNIITISATDEDSPSIKMYSQVRSFDLNDAVLNSIISPGQVAFRTDLFRLISGNNYNKVCIDRGEYDADTTYYYWDRVSYNGSLWLNVYQEGTTKGVTPGTDTNHWVLQVSKGDKGDTGEPGQDGQDGSDSSNIQIVLSKLTLFTVYDGSSYSPNLNGTLVRFELLVNGQASGGWNIESTVSDNDKVKVSGEHSSQGAGYGFINIQSCTLSPGELACITLTVKDVSTSNIYRAQLTVICMSGVDVGDGYVVSINPTACVGEYNTYFDDLGLIESFFCESKDFEIYIYKNGEVFHDAVDYVPSLDTDKVRISVNAISTEIDNSNTIDVDTNPDEDWTASFSFNPHSEWGSTDKTIPALLTHNNSFMLWPATKGVIQIHIYFPNADTYYSEIPVNFDIIGATSFWEVTTDHWISRFVDIEDNFANYSTIELTASQISAAVSQIDTELDLIRESILDISAGEISLAVIADELRKAGIDIALSEDGNSGTVDIYGDKVTIKNKKDGDDVLWVESETAKMSNVDIVGGTIGGYTISDSNIKSQSSTGDIEISPSKIHLTSSEQHYGYANDEILLATDCQTYTDSSVNIRTPMASYAYGTLSGQITSALYLSATGTGELYGLYSNNKILTRGLVNSGIITLTSGGSISGTSSSPTPMNGSMYFVERKSGRPMYGLLPNNPSYGTMIYINYYTGDALYLMAQGDAKIYDGSNTSTQKQIGSSGLYILIYGGFTNFTDNVWCIYRISFYN